MDLTAYESIISILKLLIKDTKFEGHVYSVGGCERDRILGNNIKDIDLVVDLPRGGIELAEYLNSIGQLAHDPVIYENFGTVMFKLIDMPTVELEAVHTRKETYRGDSRKPETAYGTIEEDCTRRDFTINAVYRNVSTGLTLDLNGYSKQDLSDGVIRTCGDHNIIFSEDPLRILRAIRFKYRLDFRFSYETWEGLFKYADRLSIISQERITDEFSKILCGNKANDALQELRNLGVLHFIFPNVGEKVDEIVKLKNLICLRNSKPNLIVRLAILFRFLDEDTIRKLINDMRYPNKVADDIIFIHKFGGDYSGSTTLASGQEVRFNLSEIRKAMYYAKTPERFSMLTDYLEAINKDGKNIYMESVFTIGDIMYGYKLGVNGNDIMEAFNIEPGPKVKEVLDYLLKRAFRYPEGYSDKEYCLEIAKSFIEN